MKNLGTILFVIAILLGVYALSMDTTVSTEVFGQSIKVNNIGLMSDKQNYLITSGILLLVGLIMALSGQKNTTKKKVDESFKLYLKKAQFNENNGNYKEAIDLYLETIYHLENDNKEIRLKKNVEESRIKLVNKLNVKIKELGNKF